MFFQFKCHLLVIDVSLISHVYFFIFCREYDELWATSSVWPLSTGLAIDCDRPPMVVSNILLPVTTEPLLSIANNPHILFFLPRCCCCCCWYMIIKIIIIKIINNNINNNYPGNHRWEKDNSLFFFSFLFKPCCLYLSIKPIVNDPITDFYFFFVNLKFPSLASGGPICYINTLLKLSLSQCYCMDAPQECYELYWTNPGSNTSWRQTAVQPLTLMILGMKGKTNKTYS